MQNAELRLIEMQDLQTRTKKSFRCASFGYVKYCLTVLFRGGLVTNWYGQACPLVPITVRLAGHDRQLNL
jgi:hypothetical protein